MSKKPTSGQVPNGDVRLTANIKQTIHLKLKMSAVLHHITMGELIERLIDGPLDDLLRRGLK